MKLYRNMTQPRHVNDWHWAKANAVWELVFTGPLFECMEHCHNKSSYSFDTSLEIAELLIVEDIPGVVVGLDTQADWSIDACEVCCNTFYWRPIDNTIKVCSWDCMTQFCDKGGVIIVPLNWIPPYKSGLGYL